MDRTALLLPVVLLAALAGCSAFPNHHPPSDQRAVALRNKTVRYVSSVSTYRYDGQVRAYASKGEQSRSVTGQTEGSVDRRQQLLHGVTMVDNQQRGAYLDGYHGYTQCSQQWGGWEMRNLSRSNGWFALTPLGRQVTLLERSHVYWHGNRTVNGSRTVLLEAYPSKKTLSALASSPGADPTNTDLSGVKNVTVHMWVDPDTGRPVRSLLKLTVKRGGATGVSTLRLDYSGYGKSVNITDPSTGGWYTRKNGCPTS